MADNRIRELREELRLHFGNKYARPSFARRVGVSERSLLNYEQGRHMPPVDVALAIARELSTEVEQLWPAR